MELPTGYQSDFSKGITWGNDPNGLARDQFASKQNEAAAIARAPVQIDYSNANASLAQAAGLAQQDAAMRGQQQQGLAMLQQQAEGQAPSAAAINAGQGTQMGLQGALSGMASGHSSLANAAAARQSLMTGGQAQVANVGQAGAARGLELANANQNFAATAGQARSSDYGLANGMTSIGNMQGGMAGAQAQQNLQQQQLNQAYAQNQEQQRYAMGQAMSQGEQNTLNRYYSELSDQYKANAAAQAKMDVIAGTVASSASYGMAGAATSMGGGAGDSYAGGYNGGQMSSGTGGTSSGGIMQNQAYDMPSDARAKEPLMRTDAIVVPGNSLSASLSRMGTQGPGALLLDEGDGSQLHQSLDGHAFYQQDPSEQTIGAGQFHPSLASAAAMQQESPRAAKAALPAAQRKMTDAELLAAADREIAAVNADSARRQAAPTAVDQGVLAGANRAMAGSPYRYKPEFTPPDEVPGQIHHGFMAQNLEQNPVTATAVETGPGGVKQVHGARMMQAMASGLSDLQRQVDETRAALAARGAY